MPSFIPGLRLSEIFFDDTVYPLIKRLYPDLEFSAARIGKGSDVLGFDTPTSMDRDWGPQVTVFLDQTDRERVNDIRRAIEGQLPLEARTLLSPTAGGAQAGGNPVDGNKSVRDSGRLETAVFRAIRPRVEVTTITDWFPQQIGIDPTGPIAVRDWLMMPPHALASVVGGKTFHDGLDTLSTLRDKLRWYPRDVWLYLLACQWRKIEVEEALMARAGDVGDEVGSRLIAARLVHYLMSLCFLLERRYAPYIKWFGSAFQQLHCAKKLTPTFEKVLAAGAWRDRESALSDAYVVIGGLHNDQMLTAYVEPTITTFHERPYNVPHSERFVEACLTAISSDEVRALPVNVGGVAQFVDSADVLESTERVAPARRDLHALNRVRDGRGDHPRQISGVMTSCRRTIVTRRS
jgi:hypothetical protein